MGNKPEMYDVFISYRRSDGQVVADALCAYLTEKGLRVFLDKLELEKGEMFSEQLRNRLKATPNYILIATNDVFKFREGVDWVREEIELAIQEHNAHRVDRTISTLVLQDTIFPEKIDLPECVHGIEEVERTILPLRADEVFVFSEEVETVFKEIFEVTTKINRGNLWNAAHRWLEESKKENARFAKLNICEAILPNAEMRKDAVDIPIQVSQGEKTEESKPLFQAISETDGHIFLVGQGGIGKTTALMHIMNKEYMNGEYERGDQIPIFVELSFAPDTYGELYKTEISSFIRRSVYRQIRMDLKVKQVSNMAVDELDEIFSIKPEVAVKPVTDIFSKQTPAPEYLLLLDGLNEVSTVRLTETKKTILQMITEEIQYLMKECPNVRVVLTSRFDELEAGSAKVTKLYLDGIGDGAIRQYLRTAEIPEEKIEKIFEDPNLIETLRVPLFLTMYVTLSEDNDAVTQGEILRLFFSERRKNVDLYTNQNRLEMLEENLRNAAYEVQLNRITAEMYHFMLDFVLPEIAWYMERNGKFYLSDREIETEIIEPLLTGKENTDIAGEFGREVFDKYSKMDADICTTIEKIITIIGGLNTPDFKKITTVIVSCCTETLGVLQKSNKRTGFIHQHIRDYFAALKNINTLRMAVFMKEEEENEIALECMNKCFFQEPISTVVRRFMGEYLGEHRNKPYYDSWGYLCYGAPDEDCDRNLIDRVLDVYRGYFDGECGYGIYSLLTLIHEMRGMLAGGDYSSLDLSNCSLNGVGLCRDNLISDITNAKIYGENLLFVGHDARVRIVDIYKDGKSIITFGRDNYLCIWDLKTGILTKRVLIEHSYKGYTRLPLPCFIENGSKLMANPGPSMADSKDGKVLVTVWDIETLKIEREVELKGISLNRIIHPNGKTILYNNRNKIDVWNIKEDQTKCIYKTEDTFCIDNVFYMNNGRIITIYETCTEESDSYDSIKQKFVFLDANNYKKLRSNEFFLANKLEEIQCIENNIISIIKENERDYLKYKDFETDEWKEIYEFSFGNRKLFISNRNHLFAVIDGNDLMFFDGKTLSLKRTCRLECNIREMVFHDDLKKCIVFTSNDEILVYDTDNFDITLAIKVSNTTFTDMSSYVLDNHCIICDSDANVCVWNTQTGTLVSKKKLNDQIANIQINIQKKQLCLQTYSGTFIYQLPDYKLIFECKGKGRFSEDEKYLYVDKWSSNTEIFDTETYLPILNVSNVKSIIKQIDDLIIFEETSYVGEKNCHLYKYKVVHLGEKWTETFGESESKLQQISKYGNLLIFLLEDGACYILDVVAVSWTWNISDLVFDELSILWKRTLDNYSFITKDNIQLQWEAGDSDHMKKLIVSDADNSQMRNELNIDLSSIGYANRLAVLNANEDELTVFESKNVVGVYTLNRIDGQIILQKKHEITSEIGLDVLGLDMSNLHPDSSFTEEQYEKLRMYGANL